jgi:hypothetical protein
MLNPKLETPAFAEAPARPTRLWQVGLRAGRLNSKQTQMALPTCRQAKHKTQNSISLLGKQTYLLSFIFWICLGFRVYCLEFKQLLIPIFGFRI